MIEPVAPDSPPRSAFFRSKFLAFGGIVVALAVVLYLTMAGGGKETSASSQCSASDQILHKLIPLERGAIAAAVSPKRAQPATALQFTGPDGQAKSLADFKGRVILLNLWATWCVPCREEMPTLDALQAKLGGPDFEVVALNMDTKRVERARSFFEDAQIRNLAFYADPTANVFQHLQRAGKITGLPTTYLIGRDGCEIATMAGPANWASNDALAFLRAAIVP